MGSKRLSQGLALATDMLAMRGPVSKRTVAEEVVRSCRPETWAESERREAYVLFAMNAVSRHFKSSVNSEIPAEVLAAIPLEYQKYFDDGFPRMICVSPTGGGLAEYTHSLTATPGDWQRNFELKDYFAQKIWSGRNVSRDMRNLLVSMKVNCLADLSKHVHAAE